MVNVDKSSLKLFLGLGSNLGDREKNLKMAIEFLSEKLGKPTSMSSVLETEPWGYESKNHFLNQVVTFEVDLDVFHILKITQDVEKKLGRLQKSKIYYTDRVIDVDILYYSDNQVDTAYLQVPHPKIAERPFVLDSLMELDGNWLDVRLGKEIKEIYNGLK
ncbi:MAG: 2-amino-4-hydroxy-6-hydroxymethyldihydropteridine diphosphokinase [Schleiferiaceae bacterium]